MKYPATEKYDTAGYAPPLEPGTYLVSLADVRENDDKGKFYMDKDGFKYLLFEFEVDGYPGNKLFERICFDEKNQYHNLQMGRFKQMQEAMAVPTDREGDTDELLGKTCMAVVVKKKLSDKEVNNIKAFKPVEGAVAAPPANDDDQSLPF